MNITKVLLLVTIIGVLFSCDNDPKKDSQENKQQEVQETEQMKTMATRFEELKGYFIKSNVEFDSDYKYIAVTNTDDFNQYFGIAKTMNNEVSALDFEKFNIAGILSQPSNKAHKIIMESYTTQNGTTIVSFVDEIGKEQNFSSSSLLLFKIPKSITNIDFKTNNISVNIKVK